MGKKNVVLWDGTVVAVEEDVAKRLTAAQTARPESVVESGTRQQQQYDEANTSAPRAFVEGALDTATFGGYGAVVSRMDGGHRYQVTAEQQSGARFLGELTATLAPTGLLGGTAKAATKFTAPGIADAAGKVIGGGLKGNALEGAMLGLGGSIAHSSVTGDPLTIEGALLDAGMGGIANAGMGVLASKITKRAGAAQEALAKHEAEAATEQVATKGKQLFDREYPVVDELNAARKSSISETNKLNAEITRGNEAFDEFVASPMKFRKVTKGIDDAINTVQSRYRPEGSFSTMDEALAATQQRANVRVDELNVNPNGQAPSQSVTAGPAGTSVSFRQGGVTPQGVQTSISDRVKLDPRAPMSPEVGERLTRWRREASEIRQLFAGGREVNGGRWGKFDPAVPRNPEEAVARLHALKKEIWEHAQDAAGKIPDTIPSLPQKLLDVAEELPKVKTLEYLSRMDENTIARMGNSLSQGEANAIGKLAKELDLTPGATPQETLAGIHAELKRYRKAMDTAEAAAAATEKEATAGFGGLVKHASRLVGARVGNRALGGGVVGGAIGWATGNMFGGVAGAALGSVLMNGKAGLRNNINGLFAKYGGKAGQVVDRLGPVTSVLSAKLMDSARDEDGDIRSLALRRGQELANFRGVAPDIGYVALEPFMQAPNDIALKLHQKFTGMVNHLADVAPKDPGLSPRGFSSKWVPSRTQAMEFAHRIEAATQPLKAVARALQGQGHPAAADTLWTLWPGMMGALTEELVSSPETLDSLNHTQLSAFSRLFRTPLSGFQIPEIALAAQAMYQPGAPGNPYDENPDAGFGNSPSPQPQGGRPPAAGRSEVAGSNVSRLTQ